jgi:Domain of unknown function (DUF3819)
MLQQADAKEITLVFVSDNLDIVCSFVEKASIEKAVEELMINLGPSFAIRRQYREVSIYKELNAIIAKSVDKHISSQCRTSRFTIQLH